MTGALHAIDARLKSLNVGDWLVRRNPLYYGSTRREIEALQDRPLNERVAWTQSRLEIVLRAASRTVYGERIGAPRDLSAWPLLLKDSLREATAEFCARGSWFTARASTGGTTGMPLRLIRSAASVVAEQVCRDRMISTLRLNPSSARIAVLRADQVKHPSDQEPPFWKLALGGRRLVLSSGHLSEQTFPHYLAALRGFRPDLLWVHPTMLEIFCRLLERSGETFRVAGVMASSEVLRPEVWKFAQSLLDCSLVDCYGQAERVAYAYASSPGEYYFLAGYARVELIPHLEDENGSSYEVVGTSLWNLAMPLIRYRTGDLIRVHGRVTSAELDEISYGVRPFSGVIGRSRDVLLTPDGRGVIPGLSYIPRGVDNLLRLQLVQERPDRIVFKVLVNEAFSGRDAERLLRNARERIPASAEIELEVVASLQRTEGGKTPFVVHSDAVRRALQESALSETPG